MTPATITFHELPLSLRHRESRLVGAWRSIHVEYLFTVRVRYPTGYGWLAMTEASELFTIDTQFVDAQESVSILLPGQTLSLYPLESPQPLAFIWSISASTSSAELQTV